MSFEVLKRTEEMNDAFKDLERWETDIKKVDVELKKKPKPDIQTLAPIRYSQMENSKDKKDSNKKNTSVCNTKVQQPGKQGKTANNDMLENDKKRQKAMVEKEKGNSLFSKGKYKEAVSAYTEGMKDDPTNAILPANRAMARLKIGEIDEAEKDCTTAIKLDCTYVKAFHRRGTCRFALKKYQLARQDFLKVLELEPSNKQARSELLKIDKIFKDTEEQRDSLVQQFKKFNESVKETEATENIDFFKSFETTKTLALNYDKPGRILPIEKPPNLRSKKPLKRIQIMDADEQKSTECDKTIKTTTVESKLPIHREPGLVMEKKCPISTTVVERSASQKKSLKPSLPVIPATAYQFESDWRRLRNWPDLQFEYLKQFPPLNLKDLFKQSIETEVFIGIFKLLEANMQGFESMIHSYLINLTEVGRFRTLVMFLSEEDLAVIQRLLGAMEAAKVCSTDDIILLQKLYLT